jgi:hypothetical protein
MIIVEFFELEKCVQTLLVKFRETDAKAQCADISINGIAPIGKLHEILGICEIEIRLAQISIKNFVINSHKPVLVDIEVLHIHICTLQKRLIGVLEAVKQVFLG